MSRGRPPLRIGEHGRVTRSQVAPGVWKARCRFRDMDGVTRVVQRRGPEGDKHGKAAEDALLASLVGRRPPVAAGGVSADTLVMALVDAHIEALEGERAQRTYDTYKYTASKLRKYIVGVRVGDGGLTARMHHAIQSMRQYHGAVMARQARTILRGGFQLALLAEVIEKNPVIGIEVRSKGGRRPKGAPGLSGEALRELISKVMASEDCQRRDLADPVILLAATGIRRSELLGLQWSDYSKKNRTITLTGKVVRAAGKGLIRDDKMKTDGSARTIVLPKFATDVLNGRRGRRIVGEADVIFPSSVGTLRDPENFNSQWRKAREALGVPDITSHSFRKSLAGLIDDAGLSARIGADVLGHAKVSMTQDNYMTRGRTHAQVADLLDRELVGSDKSGD